MSNYSRPKEIALLGITHYRPSVIIGKHFKISCSYSPYEPFEIRYLIQNEKVKLLSCWATNIDEYDSVHDVNMLEYYLINFLNDYKNHFKDSILLLDEKINEFKQL